MYTGKLAVCVFVFNRPQYLQKLLRSLSNQDWLDDTDFWFYSDGAVNQFSGNRWAEDVDINTSRVLCQSATLPNKEIVAQPCNVGTGIQQYMAYEKLKDDYQYVVYLDDDVILSEHWLRCCRALISWLQKDDSLFFATPSITRVCESGDIQARLNDVAYCAHGWTAYVADMEKWSRIRPVFMDYYNCAFGVDYRKRPHKDIRDLHRQNGYPHENSSQDAWKEASMRKVGLRKLRTVVNRGFYIGEVGVHATAANYKADRWEEHRPWNFNEDAHRKSFELYEGPLWSVKAGSEVG
jgi:hypothetical protein